MLVEEKALCHCSKYKGARIGSKLAAYEVVEELELSDPKAMTTQKHPSAAVSVLVRYW